ncbi:beta-galactoside alpha-2,6-sialyltransferase 2 [Callorhinchus milii]|uniref:Beta-galactoside alpha-2,6-sialyltransferase 2 n=1 Tax=Callorhinchus milii TaxID=7868 RepID=E4ZFH7_CALMI|nr:beta-galactoside alpha-2,6-sialyltransferase 2 [Callorhinchus milii]CBQ74110.1 beta-galactoside alpha 2,6-sialyltransferase ST6Gal II [Callorhinchus milii]|eukprot:gi/632939810/ref/XP_007883231.1/ PREDICTED: beta-galactoside alpha-2,6-sialyltransferase 2 [Callorhinchus milii]
MKANTKQWKHLVLIGILAWALVVLLLFIYFTDLKTDERPARSLRYTETRSLFPIQGKQRVIVGNLQNSKLSPVHGENNLYFEDHDDDVSLLGLDSLNGQNLKWTREEDNGEFEVTKRVKDRKIAAHQQPPNWVMEQVVNITKDANTYDEIVVQDAKPHKRAMKRQEQSSYSVDPFLDNLDSLDLEDLQFSKSKAVLIKLWKGNFTYNELNPRLQRAMREYIYENKHGVQFKGRRGTKKLSGDELLCELKKRVRLRTLDGNETPFSLLGWKKYVPKIPLSKIKLKLRVFRKCAVVASAGAILNSSLGDEIDSHDAVMRFNAAPTKLYEQDVGSKTTIRILNSQILANSKHNFINNALYKNIILVVWDPAPYSINLIKWYKKPDYNLFTPYLRYRRRNPAQPFYILHPRFLWQLWDIIQENTQEKIQPNPPSSGFIGIVIMMALCDSINIYEYIPSIRQTDLCHYHERYYDSACTLGAYHPLLYEKLLVQRMNKGTEADLYSKGRVSLPGFHSIKCAGEK